MDKKTKKAGRTITFVSTSNILFALGRYPGGDTISGKNRPDSLVWDIV
jgi:hypothetical protein